MRRGRGRPRLRGVPERGGGCGGERGAELGPMELGAARPREAGGPPRVTGSRPSELRALRWREAGEWRGQERRAGGVASVGHRSEGHRRGGRGEGRQRRGAGLT